MSKEILSKQEILKEINRAWTAITIHNPDIRVASHEKLKQLRKELGTPTWDDMAELLGKIERFLLHPKKQYWMITFVHTNNTGTNKMPPYAIASRLSPPLFLREQQQLLRDRGEWYGGVYILNAIPITEEEFNIFTNKNTSDGKEVQTKDDKDA